MKTSKNSFKNYPIALIHDRFLAKNLFERQLNEISMESR